LQGDWANPDQVIISSGSGQTVPVTFTPDPIGAAREVTITIEDPTLLAGQEDINVSVTDGDNSLNQSISIIHTIDGQAPELLAPADLVTEEKLSPSLSWAPAGNEISNYVVEVALDAGFTNVIARDTVEATEVILQTTLEKTTTYFWRAIALGVCQDYPSTTFQFETGVGTATIDQALSKVKLYPSPADQYMTLDLSAVPSAISFDVVDITGKVVIANDPIRTEIKEINTSPLAEGVYLLRLISDEGIYAAKFVVSR